MEHMKEILLIAPYQDMLELAQGIIADAGFDDIEAVKGDLEEGVRIATKAVESHAKVIISRGGTYRLIRDVVCFPVVEIRSSLYDLLDTLSQVIKHPAPLAIVGFSNIVDGYDLDFLSTILKTPVRKVDLQSGQDVEQVIATCAAEGYTTFLGDAVVQKACQRLSYPCYLQKSGKNAIIAAIEAARRLLRASKHEVEFAKRLRTIIDCVQEGVVATDNAHKVIICNSIAQRLFGQRIEDVLNKDIRNLSFLGGVGEEIASRAHLIDQVRTIGDTAFSISCIPIEVGGEYFGSVAVLRDIHELQNYEKKLRVMLAAKGFVARHSFDSIIYASSEMERCIAIAKKFSQYDAAVLIEGESGVGKELFAQSIHNASKRASQPFVAVNCAALPEPLLESELFGYTEGAFSGAVKGGKMGLFELAHKGTLFLDEIGEMPLRLQAKILRVLQEKEIRKIGGDTVVPVDVRIISATNINILDRIQIGQFREDLYYRINLLNLKIPPLRQRPEDIEVVFRHFVQRYSTEAGKPVPRIEPEVIELMKGFSWLGNIRELRNFSERMAILNESGVIGTSEVENFYLFDDRSHAQDHLIGHHGRTASPYTSAQSDQRELPLSRQLEQSGLDRDAFARRIGVSRTTLWRRLREEQARNQGGV